MPCRDTAVVHLGSGAAGKGRDGRRTSRIGHLWVLAAILCLLSGPCARAGSISAFTLEPEGDDGYRLVAQGLIEAPRSLVRQLLTDYANLHRLSPRILESEILAVTADGVTRLRTKNRLCVLIFCSRLRHVQLIREQGYGDFESESVAAESDLSRGHARWRLGDEGGVTRLDIEFRFALESYDWVPPALSRLVIRSALEADARALIDGIERAAGPPAEGRHGH